MIRYAPAGWDYKDWYGTVYPARVTKGFDPLSYLARYVTAVEVNSTFYGPASAKSCAAWCTRVADHPEFRFSAKLWQRFTHERSSSWTVADVDAVRAGFDVLHTAGKLGAVLLQFPFSFRNVEPNREWLWDVISTFAAYPLVVEVRHSSWNTVEFYTELAERGVGIANIDQPLFRNSLKPAAKVTSTVGYVRVHGRNYADWFRSTVSQDTPAASRAASLASRNAKFDYLYDLDELMPWADRISQINALAAVNEVFVVTNNHYLGQAVANLLQLRSLVTKQRVEVPPDALAAYPDALGPFATNPIQTSFL